ncbi:unnamed protein product [Dracunculus medinensis]|uniref:NADH dehydrogenase [ubiquinone] iron-sulfur protein 4, mitochondrial n=1 Tax=Dracunculus medinensis TaxID=318479 RepID=A0A0N4U7F2_DRAME|nr:unnamed protein product [Dracunculus medinensis]
MLSRISPHLNLTVVRKFASSDKKLPVTRLSDAKLKTFEEFLNETKPIILWRFLKVMDIAGIPEEHMEPRVARIYIPAREATQSAWNNTKTWKIELDNRQRWENPLIGWSSSGDPLSNISMALDFASKEDAIRFCEKNRWNYEVDEPQRRHIKPKSYAANFSWNKRTRVGTK